jgi:hypothetical protein
VRADHRAGLVDDPALAAVQSVPLEEVAVVTAAQEAGLLALGAVRHGQPGALRFGTRLLLRLLSEREPDPREVSRIESREHVRLVLLRIDGPRQQRASSVLDDSRVVARRQLRRTGTPREREQLRKAKAPVAARARVGRLPAGVGVDERLDDRGAERFARVQRHVWQAEPVARLARRDHRLRRAARPLGGRCLRIDPEPKRDADRTRARMQQGHGAVDAAAHRDRHAPGIRRSREDRADRVRKRVDDESLTGHGSRFQQRQPDERCAETVRVGVDDPVALEPQADAGPFAAASRVSSHFQHGSQASRAVSAPPCR